MYKYSRCLCVLLLLALFSLYAVPALADDINIPIDGYSQQELEEGVYTGSGGLSVYLDGVEQLNDEATTFGTVSDQSNLLSIGYDVYSSAFNFRTEEQFVPTADIGYTKAFADSVLTAALKDTQVNSLDTAEQVFKGIIGETIVLHYEDENGNSTLPEGSKITLNLSFDDTLLEGDSSWRKGVWDSSSPYSFNSITAPNNYVIGTNVPLLNINSKANWAGFGTLPKFYLGNVVNVYFVDTNGEQHILGSYTDMSAINTTFTSPADVVGVYIDVQYNMNGGIWVNSSMNFPSIYKLSLSGNISVDTSGVNTGLLKSIIQWLRNILNAITALPQQIADKVIDGVKTLFIPTADDLAGVFETATGKLEERLGFVYQITTWLFDLFDVLISASTNTQDIITLPKLALPWENVPDWAQLPNNELLIWNEQQFRVIPEGAESLQTIVKTLTSLWAVLSLVACCVDSYHDFVGESPIYRLSQERIETKKAAEQIVGGGKRRR